MAKFGESSDLVSCSFCGKTQKQVAKLIAGPGCYICNECIDLCNDIIDEELADSAPDAATPDPGVAGEDEERRHLREARGALRTRLGRAPTISELAAELEWTEERVAHVGRRVWFAAAPPAAGHPVDIAAELAGLQRQVDDLRKQMAERHSVPPPTVADELDTLVAAGVFDGGLRWRLHAAGTDQEYSTVLHLVGHHRGGMGGPKLPDGKLINVYTGRDDDGPLGIAVRADLSVNGVDMAMPDGSSTPLVHAATTHGLRFYVGVTWPTGPGAEQQSGFELHELRAVDHAGRIVATEDLRRWNHPA